MKIDPSKRYTCDGKPVEFLHRRPDGWPTEYPWEGIVDGVKWSWTDEGVYDLEDPENGGDLVEVREPRKAKLWVRGEHAAVWFPSHSASVWRDQGYELVEFAEVLK